MLLSNFGSSSLSAPTADNDTNKIAEAFDRIGRFINWIKSNCMHFAKLIRFKLTNQISDQPPGKTITYLTIKQITLLQILDTRSGVLDIPEDDIIADGMIFKDKKSSKDKLEVTIGEGMEFTIHGDVMKQHFKKGKHMNNINNLAKTIGNSIFDHRDFIGHLEDDEISNKSYGSHKNRFKEDSHKGSADILDDQEEKRDASKEELGIDEGLYNFQSRAKN